MRMRIALAALAALGPGAPAVRAQQLHAVWGSGPADVWAAGDNGLVAHYNGQGWVSMNTGTPNRLRAVWGANARDVWAVGDESTIMHLVGNAWSYVASPARRDFVAVGGCAANDVWIVGQSEDMAQPPVLLHWDGRSLTREAAPFAFRAAGIGLTCPAGITIAGATYFDPTPTQRRDAGVLLRRDGSSWTAAGYNGRAVTDPQIGGASWTGISTMGSTTLLAGRGPNGPVLLLSRGSGWTAIPYPTVPDAEAHSQALHLAVGADGVPVFVHAKGFGRFVNGQWATTSAEAPTSGISQTSAQQMQALAQQMQAQIAAGRQPTQEQIRQMQQLQTGMQSQAASAQQQYGRTASLTFGDEAVVWAAGVNDFYVGQRSGTISHVTASGAEGVWRLMCGSMAGLEPCASHLARGVQAPVPAAGPQPVAPEDAPEAAAPTQRQPSTPTISVPRVPKVRLPGRP